VLHLPKRPFTLHNVGVFAYFRKNDQILFPTHVGKIKRFEFGKVFWLFHFGHFFCPFLKSLDIFLEKNYFVTIIEIYRVVTKKMIFKM
jgi:hypothetical protein